MPQTTLLTLTAAVLLVFVYVLAVRPILARHNIIPLQHLPATMAAHFANRRGTIRLSEDGAFDDDAQERGEFAGFRDEEEEGEGDARAFRDEEVGVVEHTEFRDEVEEEEEESGRVEGPRGEMPVGRIGRV